MIAPLPPRVLIVEDEPRDRQVLTETARQAGLDPVVAEEGEEALDLLRRYRGIDMAVVDIHAAGMPGAKLFREMRKAVPGLYVAMLAGEASPEEIRAAYGAGAATFLRKPVPPAALRATLQGSLPYARQMRRAEEHKRVRESEGAVRRALHEIRSFFRAGTAERVRFVRWGVTVGAILFGVMAGRGIDQAVQAVDRARARAEQAFEAAAARPAPADERALQAWYLRQRLELERDLHQATRRFYEDQMDLMRYRSMAR